jgi:hypothetical protein
MMKAVLTAGRFSDDVDFNKLDGISDTLKEKLKENEKVSIIFCHADIQGASMNDNMRCREGLDISAFPPNLPIYSGHFHKPHTVRAHSLRTCHSVYVNSISVTYLTFSVLFFPSLPPSFSLFSLYSFSFFLPLSFSLLLLALFPLLIFYILECSNIPIYFLSNST